jgi:hypothetical protein
MSRKSAERKLDATADDYQRDLVTFTQCSRTLSNCVRER